MRVNVVGGVCVCVFRERESVQRERERETVRQRLRDVKSVQREGRSVF